MAGARAGEPQGYLCGLFLPHLPAPIAERLLQTGSLEDTLSLVLLRAGGLPLAEEPRPESFLPYLAAHLPCDLVSATDLLALSLGELHLLSAYNDGGSRAATLLASHYMRRVEADLHRICMCPAAVDDVKQVLYLRLITGCGRAQYTGRGELIGWLRAAARNEVRDACRKERRLTALDESILLEIEDPEVSAEDACVERLYLKTLEDAFRAAAASLSPRERDIVRHHFFDDWNIDRMGRFFGVHRATVARWIVVLRQKLSSEVQSFMLERLGCAPDDIRAILETIRHRLDGSVHLLCIPVPPGA